MFKRLVLLLAIPLAGVSCSQSRSDAGDGTSFLAGPSPLTQGVDPSQSSIRRAQGPMPSTDVNAANSPQQSVSVEHFDTTGALFNPCTGETVDVEGFVNVVFRTAISGTQVTFGLHQTVRVSGTSQITGTRYIWNNTLQINAKASLVNGVASTTVVERDRFVALGDAPGFMVATVIHVTVNANGELSAELELLGEGCVG